jgi:hypothetical protein
MMILSSFFGYLQDYFYQIIENQLVSVYKTDALKRIDGEINQVTKFSLIVILKKERLKNNIGISNSAINTHNFIL